MVEIQELLPEIPKKTTNRCIMLINSVCINRVKKKGFHRLVK